jgi:hypothetical protein
MNRRAVKERRQRGDWEGRDENGARLKDAAGKLHETNLEREMNIQSVGIN